MVRITAVGSEEVQAAVEADVAPTEPASPPKRLQVVPTPRRQRKGAPADERRGIGLVTLLASVGLDAMAILAAATLVGRGVLGRGDGPLAPTRSVVLFVVVATVLLLPLHRRGRLVPRASELVVPVPVRMALVPLITTIAGFWLGRLGIWFPAPTGTVSSTQLPDAWFWAVMTAATTIAVLLGRVVSFKLAHSVRARGFDLEDVIIVGAGSVGRDLAAAIDMNPDCGLLPIGFVDRFDERSEYPLLGRPEDLPTILEQVRARHVILGFGGATESELVGYVRAAAHLPVQFYTVPRFFELGVSVGQQGFEVDGFAVTRLGRAGRHHLMWPLKRAFDVAFAAVTLLLVSPVYVACALAVKLTSPGPVYFRQVRVSVDHVPFDILKFRTMKYVADPVKQAELDQKAQAVNLDDDRITSIGKFLRKSHLDELPQLINVLKGEMSIVGPRPERPYFVDQHSAEIEGYAHRHRVPAGITGWAQVNGYWGDSSLEARVRLDNRYIENWTPVRDLVIGLRTIPTLLGKRR